jgi:hypothetical protein
LGILLFLHDLKKIMKNISFIIAILFIGFVYPQSTIGGSGAQQNYSGNYGNIQSFGYSVKSANRVPQTDGSFYLFDSWNNIGVIYTEDNQKIKILNINLNIERHTFESKINGDSIFAFNFNNIDKFVINNKEYKNFYWDEDNKVYEVLYNNGGIQILKGFRVLFVPGTVNSMISRPRDKYIRKEFYYLRKDNKISTFKLKKSNVLKLAREKGVKAMNVELYAKNNNLSFKKEKNLKKILDYIENN